MRPTAKPKLAITMGDPAGISAEVIVKTLSDSRVFDRALPFVIGDVACLTRALAQTGIDIPILQCDSCDSLDLGSRAIQVLTPFELNLDGFLMGKVDADCGRAAVAYFEFAIELAQTGAIDAIVTCPLNKEAVHAAGFEGDIGHQEILARMTSSPLTATMLMTKGLRVIHLSTHLSLAEAVKFIKTPVLVDKLVLSAQHLRLWTGKDPKIAVAALNPHGGEGGLLGREEIEEIRPAVEQVRGMGFDIVGPYPADSIFYRAVAGEFDAVMALYHDQGHIAIKMHNFEESITATMGIPFIRTSVDHGTAFDIAGKNMANADGLFRALEAAIAMMNGNLNY